MTIPITIIAGYLGSGKTTLINRILSTTQSMQGIAVLVNDFGQINIDAQLIRSVNPQGKVYGLQNGCVCCSIEDDLAATLDQIKHTAAHHILLEASGVARPAKLRNQCNYPGYSTSTCWVVVDALNFTQKSQDKYVGNLIKEQVASADALIISKRDEAPEFQISSVQPQYEVQDPCLVQALWEQPTAQDRENLTGTHTQFATHTLRFKSVSADELRLFVTALPGFVERVKGVVKTEAGNQFVQRAGAALDVQTTLDAPSGLVLIFPAALTGELAQHLRRHAPQFVHESPPDAPL